MTDLNEAVVEVLRLDAEATQGPWRWSPPKGHSCGAFIGVCSFGDEGGGWDMQTTGNPPEDIDAELIAYYRTAAPALAREVQRLQAEIQPRIERSIAFQDAMEEAEAERDEARAEVERLKAERDAAYRAGQEAMRERCAALCSARYVEHEKRLWSGPPAKRITDRVGGMTDEAEQCAVAIRAMEVES